MPVAPREEVVSKYMLYQAELIVRLRLFIEVRRIPSGMHCVRQRLTRGPIFLELLVIIDTYHT